MLFWDLKLCQPGLTGGGGSSHGGGSCGPFSAFVGALVDGQPAGVVVIVAVDASVLLLYKKDFALKRPNIWGMI